MGVWARRGVAVVGALASFGGCYWGLVAAYPAMDAGVAVGWASVPLTVVLGVLLGWAERSKADNGGHQAPSISDSSAGCAQTDGNVTNIVSGGIQYGPLLQGRDFTGLPFGTPTSSPARADPPEEGTP